MRQPQGPPNPASPASPGRDRPPFLIEGGDLVDFSLREDTPVGTEVLARAQCNKQVLNNASKEQGKKSSQLLN